MRELIWKEHTQGVRRKQYVAIASFMMGFALLAPVMMKALPALMESQTGSAEMAAAIPVNLRESMRSFFRNIHQIATVLMVYLGASQMVYERNHRLVFSIHAGLEIGKLIWAKLLVYGGAVALVSLGSTAVSALYGKLILGGTWSLGFGLFLIGMEVGVYLIFAYLTGLLAGVWISSRILAMAMASLGLFLVGWLAGFTEYAWVFPTYLMVAANDLTAYWTKEIAGALMMTAAWSGIMMETLIWKLKRTNVAVRGEQE